MGEDEGPADELDVGDEDGLEVGEDEGTADELDVGNEDGLEEIGRASCRERVYLEV